MKWKSKHTRTIWSNNLKGRRPICAASSRIGRASVPIAEAVALRDSLIKAKEKGFSQVEVEGDSKLVIDAVNGRVEPP